MDGIRTEVLERIPLLIPSESLAEVRKAGKRQIDHLVGGHLLGTMDDEFPAEEMDEGILVLAVVGEALLAFLRFVVSVEGVGMHADETLAALPGNHAVFEAAGFREKQQLVGSCWKSESCLYFGRAGLNSVGRHHNLPGHE